MKISRLSYEYWFFDNCLQFYQGKANRNSQPSARVKKVCRKMKLVLVNFSSFLNFQTETKKKYSTESSVPKLFGFFGWNSSKILIRPILGADVKWESGLISNFMESFSNLWLYLLNLTSQKFSFVRKMAPPAVSVTIHLKLQ